MSSSRPFTMTDEEEARGVPMQDAVGEQYWKSEDFREWYAPMIYELGKEHERQILREAFNIYACGYVPITNIPRVQHDNKKTQPYIRALDKIKELFTDPDDEYADEILEHIEMRIAALSNSQVQWHKHFKLQSKKHLVNNEVKEYRHKKIFTIFNRIMDAQE